MISCDQEGSADPSSTLPVDYFEIHEFGNKDSYVFKVNLDWKSACFGCTFSLLDGPNSWPGGGERDDRDLVPSPAVLQPVPGGLEEEEAGAR